MDANLTVEALAARTGLTVRNIRAYQTSGLIEPPERRGRGVHYGEEHEQRLRAIKQLRAQGFGLEAIRRRLDAGGAPEPVLAPTAGELADVHREMVQALGRLESALERLRSHVPQPASSAAADRLRERAAHWAAGAREARELDRRRARGQTPAQRIDEGLELARIAGKAQAGRASA